LKLLYVGSTQELLQQCHRSLMVNVDIKSNATQKLTLIVHTQRCV